MKARLINQTFPVSLAPAVSLLALFPLEGATRLKCCPGVEDSESGGGCHAVVPRGIVGYKALEVRFIMSVIYWGLSWGSFLAGLRV